MKTLTKIEIILETVEHYKKYPRAVIENTSCEYYIPENGAMCAVGRCLINAKKFQEYANENGCSGLSIDDTKLFSIFEVSLKPEYRGHDIRFWLTLQGLHDGSFYWRKNHETNQNELSSDGERALKQLYEKYAE